jgi:hypothetical protein
MSTIVRVFSPAGVFPSFGVMQPAERSPAMTIQHNTRARGRVKFILLFLIVAYIKLFHYNFLISFIIFET